MHRARRFCQRFAADQRGNVLMMTGLSILVLFAAGGAAVDFGRQQLVRMKLQQASDAAAIAAASLPVNASDAEKRAMAERYFNLNYPSNYLGIARPIPTITTGNPITVSATRTLNANFISAVGVPTLNAEGRSGVETPTTSTETYYDVLLVMDTTGSMNAADVGSGVLRETTAATARAGALTGCAASYNNIGQAYCSAYNLLGLLTVTPMPLADGTGRIYLLNALCQANYPSDYCSRVRDDATGTGFGFTGTTRLNALRQVAYSFVQNMLGTAGTQNRVGLISWSDRIAARQTLTSNAATATNFIDRMYAFSGITNSHLGMNQALTDSAGFDPSHARAVILLTDGQNTASAPVNYSINVLAGTITGNDGQGCSFTGSPSNSFCQRANDITAPICTQLKNNGVQVYTIAFGTTATSGTYATQIQSFLRSCASVDSRTGQPNFFSSPDAVALNQAFSQITTSIRRIRISN